MAAAPLTVKIAVAVLVVGAIIFITGYSTPNWVKYQGLFKTYDNRVVTQDVNFGLWRRCFENVGSNDKHCYNFLEGRTVRSYFDLVGELRATQFFETMALILLVPSVILLVLGMVVESCQNRKIMPILSGVLLIVAAGNVFLGAIIFGTWGNIGDHLAWSFALTIVGGVFFGIAGVIIIVGVVMKT